MPFKRSVASPRVGVAEPAQAPINALTGVRAECVGYASVIAVQYKRPNQGNALWRSAA